MTRSTNILPKKDFNSAIEHSEISIAEVRNFYAYRKSLLLKWLVVIIIRRSFLQKDHMSSVRFQQRRKNHQQQTDNLKSAH